MIFQRLMMMQKRATIQDMLMIGAFIFAFIVVIILGKIMLNGFSNQFHPIAPGNNVSEYRSNLNGESDVSSFNARYGSLFDWIFLFVFIGLWIAVFVSMAMIDTHPALFILVIVIFAIILVVMAVIGNVFHLFAQDGIVSNTVKSFSVIGYVMDNFAFIMMVLGFVAIILLFVRLTHAN